MGTNNAGVKSMGESAKAPTAPAKNAIPRRGHPQAKVTLEANALIAPARLDVVGSDGGKGKRPGHANQSTPA
jgi:hypothetical protein